MVGWRCAVAVVSAGNGMILLWDDRQRGDKIQPLHFFPHPGVRCLEFCPASNRNMLVSGGDGGIHFWNLESGLLRASIATDAPVTGIVWSCPSEILIAHGNKLSIWKLDQPKPT